MQAVTTTNLEELIEREGITMSARRTDRNSHMDAKNMDHWRVTLKRGELGVNYEEMTLVFSMGLGLKGKQPTAIEVLDCLASDASGFDSARSFEEWAGEYGYDADSRSAERIYTTIMKQRTELAAFMGDTYDELLQCDRL